MNEMKRVKRVGWVVIDRDDNLLTITMAPDKTGCIRKYIASDYEKLKSFKSGFKNRELVPVPLYVEVSDGE